jgi:hypothetical protein
LRLHSISIDTTAFPWDKRTPGVGLESIIAVALALLIGQLTGHPAAGAIAAGSAFTIGFAPFHEALTSTLLSMTLVAAGIASATLAGSLAADWTPLVLLVILIASINYGMLSALGPTAGWIGQQAATFVIVASFFPYGLHYALGRTAMVLAGGALQMLLFTLFHLARRRPAMTQHPPLIPRLQSRLGELLISLRRDVLLRSSTAAYIARLALTLLLSTAIYRYFHIRNGYWVPMTALLVLKPQWTDTLSRGIARMVGTVGGATIALLLARMVPIDPNVILVLVILCAFACYGLQAVNYAAFSCFITLYIVFLFRFGGFSQAAAAHIRLFNTVLGGAFALLVDILWKTLAPQTEPSTDQPIPPAPR